MEKPSEEEDLQKTNLLSNRSSNKSAKNELPDINAHKNQTYVQGGSDSEEEEELTFTEFVRPKSKMRVFRQLQQSQLRTPWKLQGTTPRGRNLATRLPKSLSH